LRLGTAVFDLHLHSHHNDHPPRTRLGVAADIAAIVAAVVAFLALLGLSPPLSHEPGSTQPCPVRKKPPQARPRPVPLSSLPMPADLALMVQRPYRKVENAPDTHPPVPDDVVIQKLEGDIVTFSDRAIAEREYTLTKREFRAVYDSAPRE
jgi:hypothetical protein